MILAFNNFQWIPFFEIVEEYGVSGRVMTEPCPVTGDPIIHDIEIDEIWDMEQNKNLTKVVGHDYIIEHLNNLIL
jgi:hypothetical protein